jgi:CRP-like cAMP-binding protein
MRKVLFMFGVLNDSDIEWMVRSGQRRTIRSGEVVIEEGVPIGSIILVLQGSMGVEIDGAGEIAQIEAGDIVGEMSLVDSAPPSATVVAKIEALALFLDKEILQQKLIGDAHFASRFYRALAIMLSDRLRATERRMAYGKGGDLANENARLKDELDPEVLDHLAIAGERFDRLRKLVEEAEIRKHRR